MGGKQLVKDLAGFADDFAEVVSIKCDGKTAPNPPYRGGPHRSIMPTELRVQLRMRRR
jgi:hypothetical protein